MTNALRSIHCWDETPSKPGRAWEPELPASRTFCGAGEMEAASWSRLCVESPPSRASSLRPRPAGGFASHQHSAKCPAGDISQGSLATLFAFSSHKSLVQRGEIEIRQACRWGASRHCQQDRPRSTTGPDVSSSEAHAAGTAQHARLRAGTGHTHLRRKG